MALNKGQGSIAFLSTYTPTKCSLAKFTEDLIIAMDIFGVMETNVIAVSNSNEMIYNDKVIAEIRQNEKADYIEVANKLNSSDIDLIVIEHEYDIFGGDDGEYILDFINNLELPFVTTLHTILSNPNEKQRFIINELGKKSEKIIAMAKNTKQVLESVYGIESEKIEFIHHGVTKQLMQSKDSLKKKYRFENKKIISTFGHIEPGKGIEQGIEAISILVKEHSDILYLILGQNRSLAKDIDTSYMEKLEALVEELDLKKNVKFIHKYLTNDEVIQYLQLSDIYLAPYTETDRAVSGTLAYAIGYGKAIVSTPYPYAIEMLANGRGMLSQFDNPESLASCLDFYLKNPVKKSISEREIMKIGRTMYWDKIALCYNQVIANILKAKSNLDAI